MSQLILVVDDEPDVEVLFRQHFRRDLRAGRFIMEFAQSAPAALRRITDATGVQLILVLYPHQHAGDERSGTLAQGQGFATGCPGHHDYRLW
jgi:hypothetical protein